MNQQSRTGLWKVLRPTYLAGATLLCLVMTAACSSGGSGSVSQGLPSNISVAAISEISGFAGPPGTAGEDGEKVAVAEINSTGFLGKTKLTLNYEDTSSNPAQGVAFLNQAIHSGATVALGSVLSTAVAAEVPVAQRAKIPFLYLSPAPQFAGGYAWSIDPAASALFHWEAQYLHDKGVKTLGIVYNPDTDLTNSWATQVWPSLAKQYGLTITNSIATPTSATDPSGAVLKALSGNPGAVLVSASGTANNAILLAIKRENYQGLVAGTVGMSGTIDPLGASAQGAFWSTSFNGLVSASNVSHFVDLYKKEFDGQIPDNYAAAGYDAVWFLARAIKQANSVNAAKLNAALKSVGADGFEGAEGHLTYKDNTVSASGLLVQWNGSQEVPIRGYGS